MHASSSLHLSACLLATLALSLTNAITLNQWQPITGFSQACVNAYNTPLSGCTAQDFGSGSCSTTCIAFLEALTKILNAECEDSSADSDSLIESFFQNNGTSQLCPNVLGESGSSGYTTTQNGGENTFMPAAETSTSVTSTPSSTIVTLPILSAAPSSSSISVSSTTVIALTSVSAAATTTRVAVVNKTVPPSAASTTSYTPSARGSQTQSSSSSTASASRSSSGGSSNDGGSPLDVGSSSMSCRSTISGTWTLWLVFVSMALALSN